MSPIAADGTLSGDLLAHGQRVLAGEVAAAEPRLASTVMLLREGEGGLEVHLLHRARALAFAGGMHVFPGGAVDPEDHLPGEEPLRVAAVREVWEEVGVLLGEGDLAGPRLRGSITRWGTELVHPWANWVTPAVEPRRFDTWFWVAAMPEGQRTADDDAGGEAQGSLWVRPAEALEQLRLMPPTRAMLTDLSRHETVAGVLAAALTREVTQVVPRAVATPDGGLRLVVEPAP